MTTSGQVLTGQVVDVFSGVPLADLDVTYGGLRVRTGPNGRFAIDDVSISSARSVEVQGSSVHDYTTYPESARLRLMVAPRDFDMGAFNDIGREKGGRTTRWLDRPAVYIDTRPHDFRGDPDRVPEWAEEIRRRLPSVFGQWTGGAVTPARVEMGENPPRPGTAGTIVVRFDENPVRYPNDRAAGVAEVERSANGTISSATIRFRFSGLAGPASAYSRQGLFAHELGHALGFSHMDESTSSVMAPVIRTPVLTGFDLSAGEFLYSRPPGNTSMDRDPPVPGMVPSAMPTETVSWSCDVGEHLESSPAEYRLD